MVTRSGPLPPGTGPRPHARAGGRRVVGGAQHRGTIEAHMIKGE